ncbi:MAG: replicative DNA helicase [Terriglobia bacterium]|jgi:replicative DNA helicase
MKSDFPQNLEAERAVLGSILLDNTCFYQARERVSPSDFSSQAHRVCFETIANMLARNIPADFVSLTHELERHGLLEKARGHAYISSLTDSVPIGTTSGILEYCRIVKEQAILRSLLILSSKVQAEVGDRRDTDEILESAESYLSEIRGSREKALKGPFRISEVASECIPILEKTSGRGVMIGIPTGFAALDGLTAGWAPSDFVIIAARPSVGKTALGLEFVLRAAKAGNSAAIFSLEMSRASLVLRIVCREARVDHHKMRTGFLSTEEQNRLVEALARISKLPIWIDDRPGLSASDIRWRIRSLAKRDQLKLAVVDYLQLITAKAENRTQEVTKISMELKSAARDLGELTGGTLIAISQLNRIAANERPRLHHLRESGQLEQDADTVILISDAEESENGQEDPSSKLIDVAKQRNGPCGSFKLLFLPKWVGFESESVEKSQSHEPGKKPAERSKLNS